MDITGQIYASKITQKDLLSGKYDFARLDVFLVNYNNPNSGKLIQNSGLIGEVTLKRNLFHAEVRGLTQFLSQTLCESYSPHCRALLGDKRCGVDLNNPKYKVTATITSIINKQTFKAINLTQEDGWFNCGYLTWDSGNNKDVSMEVKEFTNSIVTLVLPMSFSMNVGDRFTIIAGCDKVSDTCIKKFNNIINFRGEPELPGCDKLVQTAGTTRKRDT